MFVCRKPLRRMNSDSIYDMSSMTAQLPPKKKGLSRYYEGRSQSFRVHVGGAQPRGPAEEGQPLQAED
ncbi:hypothetical protein EJB05_36753 [Eragrostis curvula]|uniref:Uncharacterized protein n=1 Tax=Eragrostis curvula TaxID=38414 RepID=A0A5J9UBG8_9POAL|nr:hypothetical protein EJB05_36753 [Eragrostis curvula]